jgi:hypothetical protein
MPLYTMPLAADWIVFNVSFGSGSTPVSLWSLLSASQQSQVMRASPYSGTAVATLSKRVVMNVTIRAKTSAINVTDNATSGATWALATGTAEDYPVEGGLDKIFIASSAATAGTLELKVFLEATI